MKPLKLLLVEDNPFDVELILIELKRGKITFESILAQKKEDFLHYLTTEDPDIIISDFNNPGFMGHEVLSLTRMYNQDIPFIMLSGVLIEEEAVSVLRSGATDFITKSNLNRLPYSVIRAIEEYHNKSNLLNIQGELNKVSNELELIMYKASHNLKAPTSSIEGIIALARRTFKDPEILEYIYNIEICTQSMNNITNSLIRLSELRHGAFKTEVINIEKLVRDLMEKLEPQRLEKKASIHFTASLKDITLHSDKNIVLNSIHNIVQNALIYHSKPTILKIELGCIKKGNDVIISVSDNGDGIENRAKNLIFNMFYRGHEKSKGNGLGLYYAKTASILLGGDMKFDSKEGIGSRFEITFKNMSHL